MATSSRHTKGLIKQLVGLRQPTVQVLFQKGQTVPAYQTASLSNNTKSAKEPVVIATEGKWVRVKGHDKPLINFTSKDFFGIQNHPLLDKAELESLQIRRNIHVHPSHTVTVLPQQHFQRTLAQLHSKDDVMLTSNSFDVTLHTWLSEMLQDDGVVYMPKDCTRLNDLKGESVLRYSDINELEKELAARRQSAPNSLRFVLVEAGVTHSSVQRIREVCLAAERQFATVVLLDPHAISHVRTAMGESEETLRILRRPAIIQTSLSVLGGNNTGCYVAGVHKHITFCRKCFTAQSQILSEQGVRRMLKALELLPARRLNAQIANLHCLSLRLQLEGAHISVEDAGLALSVHVQERTVAENVSEALRRKGFHVDLKEGHLEDFELQFAVNGYHTGDDIANFRIALLHELHKHGVIASPSTSNKQPGISYAFIDSNGVEELVSYKDIVGYERRLAKSEKYPSKLFVLHGDHRPRDSLRDTLVRTNLKSTVPRKSQDLTYLNDVYCWSEKDVTDNKEIYDNVMWASPCLDGENDVTNGDVTSSTSKSATSSEVTNNIASASLSGTNKAKVSSSANPKVPSDMKYLESLYCSPMFEDTVTEGQKQ